MFCAVFIKWKTLEVLGNPLKAVTYISDFAISEVETQCYCLRLTHENY